MKVRDRRFSEKSYKGREIECPCLYCPCLPCYNCHDAGYFGSKGWVKRFVCLTQHINGCPDEKTPAHVFKHSKAFDRRKERDKFRCVRCGLKVQANDNFHMA